jgi:hypothetical protein
MLRFYAVTDPNWLADLRLKFGNPFGMNHECHVADLESGEYPRAPLTRLNTTVILLYTLTISCPRPLLRSEIPSVSRPN